MRAALPILFFVLLACSARGAAEAEPRVKLDPLVVTPIPIPVLKIAEHPMLEPRFGAAVVAEGPYLYVIGGSNSAGTRLDTIERINLTTGRAEAWTRLKIARRHHRAVLIGGQIYVLGGTSGLAGGLTGEITDHAGDDPPINAMLPPSSLSMPRSPLAPPEGGPVRHLEFEDTVEIVDLATGRVSAGPPMPVAKALFGCVVVNDRILVIGGQKQKGDALFCTNTTEVYDPATRRWSAGVNMPTARRCVAAVVDEFVLVIGGYNGRTAVDTVEIFSPREQAWIHLPPVAEKINPTAAVWMGSNVFLFGDRTMRTRQLVYDLRAKRLAPYPLALPDSEYAAALAHEGKLYLVGGGNLRLHATTTGIQVFEPIPEPPLASTVAQ